MAHDPPTTPRATSRPSRSVHRATFSGLGSPGSSKSSASRATGRIRRSSGRPGAGTISSRIKSHRGQVGIRGIRATGRRVHHRLRRRAAHRRSRRHRPRARRPARRSIRTSSSRPPLSLLRRTLVCIFSCIYFLFNATICEFYVPYRSVVFF